MDPITHGIAGALLGKGYFADRKGSIAVFALTLGAVFPDVDETVAAISRDPLAIVKYHRAITHSFVAMPVWAALLAWGTIWVAKRIKIEAPSWATLTLIYSIGIASHILLDGLTSFGTRMWTPLSPIRVAWDILFIIDLTLTAILLLPQVAAWIYQRRERSWSRAALMWVIFSLAAFGAWFGARAFGTPFHLWVVCAASGAIAAVFFLPAIRGWGFSIRRSAWCRAGVYVTLLYIACCGVAHHSALERVKRFTQEHQVAARRMGAIPQPPSMLDWRGEIRVSDGVYEAIFDLRRPPETAGSDSSFEFIPDSPHDSYIARAMRLPGVQLYWQFARFPVIRSLPTANGGHVVDFYEARFGSERRGAPQPFTYEVAFDSSGAITATGWKRNAMLMPDMRKVSPQPAAEKR